MTEEVITKGWMEQLGVEDGAALADRVLDDLQFANSPELIDYVAAQAVASINELSGMYRDRGVSDELILAWRVACHNEMRRIFGEARGAKDQTEDLPLAEDKPVSQNSLGPGVGAAELLVPS